jgi:hypothetical protein
MNIAYYAMNVNAKIASKDVLLQNLMLRSERSERLEAWSEHLAYPTLRDAACGRSSG